MLFPRKETKLSALRKIFKVKKDGKMLLNLKFQDKMLVLIAVFLKTLMLQILVKGRQKVSI